MPRQQKGPRLYLDPTRRTWVVRDYGRFIRTGFSEDERDAAEKALNEYLFNDSVHISGESVYFICANNLLKIGRARDVKARFDALQRFSPMKLRLLWAQPGGSEVEARFHRRFAAFRTHGEWFEIRDELEEFISQYVNIRRKCATEQKSNFDGNSDGV